MGAGTLEEGGKTRAPLGRDLRARGRHGLPSAGLTWATSPTSTALSLCAASPHRWQACITLEVYKEAEGNTVETCAAVRRVVETEFPSIPNSATSVFVCTTPGP